MPATISLLAEIGSCSWNVELCLHCPSSQNLIKYLLAYGSIPVVTWGVECKYHNFYRFRIICGRNLPIVNSWLISRSFYTGISIHLLMDDGSLGPEKVVHGYPDAAKINFVTWYFFFLNTLQCVSCSIQPDYGVSSLFLNYFLLYLSEFQVTRWSECGLHCALWRWGD